MLPWSRYTDNRERNRTTTSEASTNTLEEPTEIRISDNNITEEFNFFKDNFQSLKDLHQKNSKNTTLKLCKEIDEKARFLANLANNIGHILEILIKLYPGNTRYTDMQLDLWTLMQQASKIAFDAKTQELQFDNFLTEENVRLLTYQQTYMPGIINSFTNLTIKEFKNQLANEQCINPEKIEEILAITSQVLIDAIYSAQQDSLLNLQLTGMREHYFQLMQENENLTNQHEENLELNEKYQNEILQLTQKAKTDKKTIKILKLENTELINENNFLKHEIDEVKLTIPKQEEKTNISSSKLSIWRSDSQEEVSMDENTSLLQDFKN